MCILSNVDIRRSIADGSLVITPYDDALVQPSSYDLRIAEDIELAPRESKLSTTIERLYLPDWLRGQLAGRSGVARLFIQTHCQGGYVDPGFVGDITLELTNLSDVTRRFLAGDALLQIEFAMLSSPADPAYRGHYQGQRGTTPSRFYEFADRLAERA